MRRWRREECLNTTECPVEKSRGEWSAVKAVKIHSNPENFKEERRSEKCEKFERVEGRGF